MSDWFNHGLLFGFGLVVAYIDFKVFKDLLKAALDPLSDFLHRKLLIPRYRIKGLPLNIFQVNSRFPIQNAGIYVFTIREGDENIRVNSPGDINFSCMYNEDRELKLEWENSFGYKSYGLCTGTIPLEESGKLNIVYVDKATLKEGVSVKAIMIESHTAEGDTYYWLYGDGLKGKNVSENNPIFKKYEKLREKSLEYMVNIEEDMS